MKRDMDLCRKILLALEDAALTTGWVNLKIDDFTEDAISFHVMLLSQAGLIQAVIIGHGATNQWRAFSLTWDGCEFLDAARDNRRWKQIKEIMLPIGGFIFEVAKPILVQLARGELHLPPG